MNSKSKWHVVALFFMLFGSLLPLEARRCHPGGGSYGDCQGRGRCDGQPGSGYYCAPNGQETRCAVMQDGSFSGRIAISSISPDLEGDIDLRFARCPYFLILSVDQGEVLEVYPIENVLTDARGGAGPAVVEFLAAQNVDCVITGRLGPNAQKFLVQQGISFVEKMGSKTTALEEFLGRSN